MFQPGEMKFAVDVTDHKVKLRAPRHQGVVGEWKYSSTHSLTLELDGGEWSASRPGRFTPRGRTAGTTG